MADMDTNNLRHWAVLSKTDPKQTKGFTRAGGFRGTAVRPIYTVQKMTEHFGPCGIGWGMEKPEFVTMPAADETLVYCTVALWYRDGSERGVVYGVGGDKVVTKGKEGPRTSDEAFKAAYTDALSNAMKQIGVSADVHMGLFDDHKYVRDLQQEFAEESPKPRDPPRAAPRDPPKDKAPNGSALPPDAIKAKAETITHKIKTAPNIFALDAALDDARGDMKELPEVTYRYITQLYERRKMAMEGVA